MHRTHLPVQSLQFIGFFFLFQTFDSDHYQTSATFFVCCFLSLYQVRLVSGLLKVLFLPFWLYFMSIFSRLHNDTLTILWFLKIYFKIALYYLFKLDSTKSVFSLFYSHSSPFLERTSTEQFLSQGNNDMFQKWSCQGSNLWSVDYKSSALITLPQPSFQDSFQLQWFWLYRLWNLEKVSFRIYVVNDTGILK